MSCVTSPTGRNVFISSEVRNNAHYCNYLHIVESNCFAYRHTKTLLCELVEIGGKIIS